MNFQNGLQYVETREKWFFAIDSVSIIKKRRKNSINFNGDSNPHYHWAFWAIILAEEKRTSLYTTKPSSRHYPSEGILWKADKSFRNNRWTTCDSIAEQSRPQMISSTNLFIFNCLCIPYWMSSFMSQFTPAFYIAEALSDLRVWNILILASKFKKDVSNWWSDL